MISDVILTLFFVFLNGFFVAAEFAIVKVRHSQIELKIREGNSVAKITQLILNNLDAYLSATQLGITLASLGLGWIGESVVSALILDTFAFLNLNLSPESAHQISLPIAFLSITILHIVFGELAPKTVAIQKSEQTSLFISIPLLIFYRVFKPFIWLLNGLATHLIKLFGLHSISEEGEHHSSEEIRYIIKESPEESGLSSDDKELLENIFDFSSTPIRKIMVPRNRVFGVEQSISLDNIIDMILNEGFSRVPVYNKSLDNIVGVLYSKDLLNSLRYPNLFTLLDLLRPVYFVDENEKIKSVLDNFKKSKIHFAVVQDEFGGTEGIVTLEDILEEIVGEIQDEYDEEKPPIQTTTSDEYIIDATITIDQANEYLPKAIQELEDYDTISGYIFNYSGKIPAKGEIIELEDYICEILESSNRKIESVKFTRLNK